MAIDHTQGNSATLSWLLYDGHGNWVRMMAPDYSLSERWQFRGVWGEVQGNLNLGRGYCANLGHPEDETGLVYMRARYYEPATGRFISEDPARDGMNWYLYADGNPVTGIDPEGTFTFGELFFTIRDGVRLQAGQAQAAFRTMSKIREFAEDIMEVTDFIVSMYLEDLGEIKNEYIKDELRKYLDEGSRDLKKWRKWKAWFTTDDGQKFIVTFFGEKGGRRFFLPKARWP